MSGILGGLHKQNSKQWRRQRGKLSTIFFKHLLCLFTLFTFLSQTESLSFSLNKKLRISSWKIGSRFRFNDRRKDLKSVSHVELMTKSSVTLRYSRAVFGFRLFSFTVLSASRCRGRRMLCMVLLSSGLKTFRSPKLFLFPRSVATVAYKRLALQTYILKRMN